MVRFQRRGSMADFETLFSRHREALLAFLVHLAGDVTAAEDVSQQTWLKVIDAARRGAWAPRAAFRTWLFTLARNHYIDEYHRRHANTLTGPLPDTPLVDEESGRRPEETAVEDERARLLHAAMQELPREQREVLALWATGTSIEEMVQIIGAPRDTVLSRRKYGLKRLRRSLAARGMEDLPS